MRTYTCCDKYEREVNIRRRDMAHAARKASRTDRELHIEAANQARAAYIKAKAALLEHVAGCTEDKP
jgi:hypothetical protein